MRNEKLEKLLLEKGEGENWKALDDGMKRLLRTYYLSKDEKNISNMLIVDDIIWDKELKGFVEGLKENDVNEFVFSSTWSGAIDALMYFIENGYQVDGTVIYSEQEWFGKKEIKKGIKLVLR